MKTGLKKAVSLLLTWMLLAGLLCGCDVDTYETSDPAENSETSFIPESTDDTTQNDAVDVEQTSHYKFDPYLVPEIQTEVCGEKMTEAYHNFIDAVLRGETSYACEDETVSGWMFGQFPYACCPVVARYVQVPLEHSKFENGRGFFDYTVPYEEFRAKYDEFAEHITGILNEVLEDDYTDFEKAIALYKYCSENYQYDYDLEESLAYEPATDEEMSAYRVLTDGIGICQNISVAYSFLLLQAGVDATVCSGFREYDGAPHQWSFVRIDEVYYHIDVTYALETRSLSYFMMTDEQRYADGCYRADQFNFVNNYNHECIHKNYFCNDDRFNALWAVQYDDINFNDHTISYTDYDESGNEKVVIYDYRELTS